jgi:serine/threonine-protein kinase
MVGMQQAEAVAAIEGAGLVVGEVTQQEVQDESQVGAVLDTQPGSGAQVEEGSEVALTVGQAPDTITVPSVIGLAADRAQTSLEDQGFTRINTVEVDSLEDEGQVIDVDPAEGAAVAPTTAVSLSVSDGDKPIPPVTGDQAAATQALRTEGFTNITVQQVEDPAAAGTVLGTTPAAGQQATAATEIVLRVSQGPAAPTTVTVPRVIDQPQAAATSQLQALGFAVTVTQEDADPDDVGVVIDQNPAPNAQLQRGATVTIVVGRAPSGNGNGNGNGNTN